MRVLGPAQIELLFRTPQGRISRLVSLTQPSTITDDINPVVLPIDLVPIGD